MKKVFLLMVFMSLPLLHDSLIAVGRSVNQQATLVIFVLSCATLLNLLWFGVVALFRHRDRTSALIRRRGRTGNPTKSIGTNSPTTNPLLRPFQVADNLNKVWLGPEIPRKKSSGDSDDETEAKPSDFSCEAANEAWMQAHKPVEDFDPPVTKHDPDEFFIPSYKDIKKMWETGLDPNDPNHRRRYLLARKAIDEPSKAKTQGMGLTWHR